MTAPTRPLDHYCMACRYALDHFTEPGRPARYQHPKAVAHLIGPHEPLPVPLVELLHVNMICDICSAPDPAHAYQLADVHVRSQRGREELGEWWTICVDCAPPLESRDIAGLVGRAEVAFERRGETPPEHLYSILVPVYRRMLAVDQLRRVGARELLSP